MSNTFTDLAPFLEFYLLIVFSTGLLLGTSQKTISMFKISNYCRTVFVCKKA